MSDWGWGAAVILYLVGVYESWMTSTAFSLVSQSRWHHRPRYEQVIASLVWPVVGILDMIALTFPGHDR